MDAEALVIGAGISGLCAAYTLQEGGVNVLVLEARDRVGGRTFTVKNPKVNYVDMGGSYVGPSQDRLLRLAESLGVENYKINNSESHFWYKNGQQSHYGCYGVPKRWNFLANMDVNYIFWLMDEMGKEIPACGPWNAPKADEWDTMSYRTFLKKQCSTQAAIDFFEGIISVFIASEAYEASLLSVLWYIKQCGGTKRIFSETNGAQERKFVGGSQQISEKLAEKIDNVFLDSPVYEINQESQEFVIVKTINGNEYKVKYVILAIPPILQMKIHFKPDLPPLRNQLMQRVPMGSVMKAILYYKTPFWRKKGFCGSFILEGDDSVPVFFTLDDTKPDGSCPAIVGFICADKCRRILSLSPQERQLIVAKSYAKATGCSEFLEPVHYEEKNWLEEQYSGGCYTAVYPPGFFTRYGKHIRTPIDRLFFAGTETAIKWSGYMDGAVEAGERAAREILHKMGKISKDQIWVEEPQHEDVVPRPFPESFMEKYSPSVPNFLKIVTCSMIIGVTTIVFLKCPRYR